MTDTHLSNTPENEWVWVIDDDKSIRWVLEKALQQAQITVKTFENAQSALTQLQQGNLPSVIITDIRMPGMDGLNLLEQLQQHYPTIPVIIITAFSDLATTVTAFQTGAFEYLAKPFDVDFAVELVQRAINNSQQRRAVAASNHIEEELPAAPQTLIGTSAAMQEVFRAIGRLSRSHITVLITGESGTGKELVARALHCHSPRADRPFIALNMAAIPKDLLESELFGHERGAFTGAVNQRRGRFEQADGGTLFLDEIGDMPAELQTRLLRVLSDGMFFRVGGYSPLKVDVRIIAATHQNLEARVQKGEFREDLFHRLNVIRVQLPPLRKRREDIPLLIRHFLQSVAKELRVEAKNLNAEVERYLSQLDWMGNVRQLENFCRWLTVMAAGKEICLEDLPADLRPTTTVNLSLEPEIAETAEEEQGEGLRWELYLQQWAEQRLQAGVENLLSEALPRFEKVLLQAALKQTHGKRQEAARLLGWGRNTLTRKLKENE